MERTFSDNFEQAISTLTSPQVVQAFLVGVFSIVAAVLVLDDRAIPETISGVLFAVVGYYFADARSKQAEARVREAVRRTDELTAYARRVGLHAQVEPTDTQKATTSERLTPVATGTTARVTGDEGGDDE